MDKVIHIMVKIDHDVVNFYHLVDNVDDDMVNVAHQVINLDDAVDNPDDAMVNVIHIMGNDISYQEALIYYN